jgi:hypothetical protein
MPFNVIGEKLLTLGSLSSDEICWKEILDGK